MLRVLGGGSRSDMAQKPFSNNNNNNVFENMFSFRTHDALHRIPMRLVRRQTLVGSRYGVFNFWLFAKNLKNPPLG